MQTTLENETHQTQDAGGSSISSTHEQSQEKTHADLDKVCDKPKMPHKCDDDVVSEYLPDLPSFLQSTLSAGKRLYSGCVRLQHKKITLYLLDADLWQRFRKEGTEMIITKKGRRVFPVPSYALIGLEPEKLYDVTLAINSVDQTVHKFSNGEWIPSKEGSHLYPTPAPGRSTYMHPFSPNTGHHWMREPITFSGLKISNNLDAMGTIVLQSMRKYMMSLIISELNGSMTAKIPQPETLFVAVTQYQNEKVTQMKIEHNPFANGFRFTTNKNKEKTKRRLSMDADSEDENRAEVATSNNPSPLDSSLPIGSSSRENSESMTNNTNKLAEREVLKHLLPVYIDHLRMGAWKQNQSTDHKSGSWSSNFMPSHSTTYSVYNSFSDFTEKSPKRGFMIGEANPLAQVRKFGELNRCSHMDSPLSLVKKKKREDDMIQEKCTNTSSRTQYTSLPDFGHSSRIRFTNQNHVNKDILCHLQTPFAEDYDVEHANVNEVNTKIGQEKTGSSPQSRSSGRDNELLLNKTSVHLLCGTAKDQHGETLENDTFCQPTTSFVSRWRSTDSDDVWQQDHDISKELRIPENYSSVDSQTESCCLTILKPEVTLKNVDLWATTHEVVISSEGRPMFPLISLSVHKLDPNCQYHISLKLLPNTPWFYDYIDHEWTESLEVTGIPYKRTIYPHPDNPKSGCQWGTDIVFDRLRLSTLKQGKNTVKLQLRRQYLPVVTIDTENQVWEYPMKDAIFITVKIDRSPYLMSGSSVCYPTSTPEFDRIISERLTRSAHRKQTNPKRRTTETFHDPAHLWTLTSLPAQLSPLDLKTTISTSSRVSLPLMYQLSPDARTFSSSSSLASAVSTPSAPDTAVSVKDDSNQDSGTSDSVLIQDYSYLCDQKYAQTSLVSGSNSFLPTGNNECDVDSVMSNVSDGRVASFL